MKILPHFVHRVAAFGILGAVLSFAYISNSDLFKAPRVESASTVVNVSGYAWMNTPQSAGAPDTGTDQGLGWMSFKGVAGDGSSYGVKLDLDTEYFSGYAWIGNEGTDKAGSTGWVDFAPTSGYPETPNHGVRKETDGTLTGWAQVVSMYDENPNNGWIKMSGTATDESPYGVTVGTDGRFSGKAWGSDVIGWVDFAPSIAVENGEEPHIETVACTLEFVVSPWTTCAESSDFCSSNPAGAQITGTQMGTCGAGYSGTAVQSCDVAGKTCGSTGCTTDTDCGGGETCLSGTSTCGSAETGCGNNVCNADTGESLLTCPQDCRGTIKQF